MSFYQTVRTPLQLALVVLVERAVALLLQVVTEQQVFLVLFLQLAVVVVGHLAMFVTGERVGQVVVALGLLQRQAQPHREKALQVAPDFKVLPDREAVAVAVKAQ